MSQTHRESVGSTNRVTELIAVVLLGIATVGTAWCGYQSTRWNSEQQEVARTASDARVEANRQFGLAVQTVQYDANMIAQYARAVADGDSRLQEFFRTAMFRPDFLPVLERWEEAIEQGESPPNLLTDQAYLGQQLDGYEGALATAESIDAEAREAGDNGDDYVLLTLLLASALFFAGVTTSFRVRTARLLLLACASVAIALALSRIATMPVA